jgi:hypothetical protein
MSYIYLIKEENGRIKIGYSNDVESRLNSLKSSSPYDMEILYSARIPTAREVEATLHRLFGNKRKRGEWFDLDDRDVAEIRSLLKDLDKLVTDIPTEVLTAEEVHFDKVTDIQKIAINGLMKQHDTTFSRIVEEALSPRTGALPNDIDDLSYQSAVTIIKYWNGI